jgi:hypothetical protein
MDGWLGRIVLEAKGKREMSGRREQGEDTTVRGVDYNVLFVSSCSVCYPELCAQRTDEGGGFLWCMLQVDAAPLRGAREGLSHLSFF